MKFFQSFCFTGKSQNLWNKTFEPLKLCQSDHFSVDQRETIELQLLAAKNLLQLTLNKGKHSP